MIAGAATLLLTLVELWLNRPKPTKTKSYQERRDALYTK